MTKTFVVGVALLVGCHVPISAELVTAADGAGAWEIRGSTEDDIAWKAEQVCPAGYRRIPYDLPNGILIRCRTR